MDRWTNIVWRDGGGSLLAGFAYSFDAAGMITQQCATITGSPITKIYAYDSLDRLISVTSISSSTSHWSYASDLAGNRTQMVANGVTTTYALGVGDRLASWGINAENTVQYDTAGNVTNMAFGDGRTVSLAWNVRYQVTETRTNGIVVERHGYDALGRRAWTWDGAATNFFVYDGVQVLADVDRKA
jgi:uncharacterized protein RhaS with RHS repeats